MEQLRLELVQNLTKLAPTDGLHATTVPGVYCSKFSKTDKRTKRQWRACFGMVAQGGKEILIGSETYTGEVLNYTVSPVLLPVISRIAKATPDHPFLAMLIDFNPMMISEVANQIEAERALELPSHAPQAIFIGKAPERLVEACVRLAKILQSTEDGPVLGPMIIREVFYHLLKTENGPAIRQFARSGSKMHKISQSIFTLKSELYDELNVEALAKTANMSRSAFFKHFKEVTAMSPIQYQKRLRLLEARRLMTEEGESAERSAFKVGYNSPSQFSREYSRMFGNAPFRDTAKAKLSRVL